MSDTEKVVAPKPARKDQRFAWVDEKKRPALTDLNRRTREVNAERKAFLDSAHGDVVKAVDVAFGKGKEPKPVAPKGSPRSAELKREAAKAKAAEKSADDKAKA